MKRFLSVVVLLVVGCFVTGADVNPNDFNLTKPTASYLTYDEGLVQAKAEHKSLIVCRRCSQAVIERREKQAEKEGAVFAVAGDNDRRVGLGTSRLTYIPARFKRESYVPEPKATKKPPVMIRQSHIPQMSMPVMRSGGGC